MKDSSKANFMNKKVKKLFGPIFQPELMEEIEKNGSYKTLPAQSTLIDFGDYLKNVPLVIEGSIKILRTYEDNEIALYFIHPGQTCAMSLTCCLGHMKSEIKAVAETDLELLLIPVQKLEEWSSRFKSWRNFTSQSYHYQFMEAFKAIDSIAFSRLDERLSEYLKNIQEINQSDSLKITHQEIANDLNSSRVVISRLLKRLEQEDRIELNHNCIKLKSL